MKAVILALVIVCGVFAQDDLFNLWSSWKLQFGKEYEDAATEAHRFAVFQANKIRIDAWNAAGNTAVLALGPFADLTNEEFAAMYTGAFPADEETVAANTLELDTVGAPDSWDWRTQGAVTPVKNQGQCGSCWAFSTVACVEGLYKINGHALTSFSEQQIVDCSTANYGCNGGWPYKAFTYVAGAGLETESDYPYTAKTGSCHLDKSKAIQTGVTGYAFVVPRSAAQLKAAIANQPISVIVEADQDVFQHYHSGVVTTGCGTNLDHAITAVGYGNYSGQDAFFVKNSWGTSWGVNGYIYISTSTQYNNGAGACGIMSQPQYPKGLKN